MHNKRKGGESGSCTWTRIGSKAQSAKLAARRRLGSKPSLSSAIRFFLDVDLCQVHCPRACGCRRCLGLRGKGERTNGQARQRILKVKRRDLCVLHVVPRCCQRSGGTAMVKNTDPSSSVATRIAQIALRRAREMPGPQAQLCAGKSSEISPRKWPNYGFRWSLRLIPAEKGTGHTKKDPRDPGFPDAIVREEAREAGATFVEFTTEAGTGLLLRPRHGKRPKR